MQGEEGEFDPGLTVEQQERVRKLTQQQVSEIDSALLSQASPQWRKVARVVCSAMLQLKGRYVGIPDVYYAKRVAELVSSGVFESQGNLRRMRFSEVRLRPQE